MDFSEKMMKEYGQEASRKLAAVCRYLIFLFALMVVLGWAGIFTMPAIAYFLMYVSMGILLIPTIFYNLFKLDTMTIRIVVLSLLNIMCAGLYTVMSYHVIIIMLLPLVVSCLYRERRCVTASMIGGILGIIVGHIAAFYVGQFPDPSLKDIQHVITGGIVPRIVEYLAISLVCVSITDCFNELVKKLNENNNQMYRDQESLISSLSTMIEMQSQETGQHVRRVSEYTKILCRALGNDETETWKIGMAAMMHDVGKIAVPREILEKPGKLTDEEFLVIKRHIFYGKEILEQYPGEIMQRSAIIAYQHHEHFDGTGYMGMQGEEISREAQCVALADFFDALVSKRSYKAAWTPEQARAEILAQKGKYFDSYIVNLFDIHFVDFLEVYRMYPDD